MDEHLIISHNSVVGENDTVIHAGDFTLWKNRKGIHEKYISKLNGKHIFLRGSHDYWLKGFPNNEIWERNITVYGKRYYFVVCHYAMRTWARSHHNSIQLFGHSHGTLSPIGRQYDVGVDNNNFMPVSDIEIVNLLEGIDNPNLIRKKK